MGRAETGWLARAWPVLGAALIAALLVEGGRTVVRDRRRALAVREAFARSTADPYRRMEGRLSYPPADRHRPASIRCPGASCALLFSQSDLARLERAQDRRGLAAAFALEGERARSIEILRALPPSPENESDLAALLLDDPRSWNEALERLTRALQAKPDLPAALFNRALLLERLDLPQASARGYRAVAALDEPGWAGEARARADRMESGWKARLAAAARAAPPRQEPPALAALAERLTIDSAEEYQRLARASGDAALEVRGWQLQARALVAAGRLEDAEAAFDQAASACDRRFVPDACIETMRRRADHLSNGRKLQLAKKWALRTKELAITHGVVTEEAWANLQLQNIEEMRQNGGLAAAFAEETSLQDVVCPVRQIAGEYLAKLAIRRGDFVAAEAELARVQSCGAGQPRFDTVGLEVLAELLREPGRTRTLSAAIFEDVLAKRRAGPLRYGAIELAVIDVIEGRAKVLTEPDRARAVLRAAIEATEAAPGALAEIVRVQAFATLVMQAAAGGRFAEALDLLVRRHRVAVRARCLAAVVADSGRRLTLVRSATGALTGRYDPGPAPPGEDGAALLAPDVGALSDCADVSVLATPPFLGESRLLPDRLAWGYLVKGAEGAVPARPRRVLVTNVEPPAELGLPRLTARLVAGARPDEEVEIVEGRAATPANVLEKIAGAHHIELHAHGIIDPEVSDMASLVLSGPDARSAMLTASELAGVSLRGRPGVVLGACTAAQRAPYGALPRSLPMAFLRAGASWVMASPRPVEDIEAPGFFEGIWRRIRAGATPAVALRDERIDRRWDQAQGGWTRDVVIFQ